MVLGIGIAQQFWSSIKLGIVLVCRPWYSPSLKAGFRKRKEKDDTPEIPRAKKPSIEQAPTMEISRSWGLAENDGEYLPEGWRNEKVAFDTP